MNTLWVFAGAVLVALLTDVARGMLMRGVEQAALGLVKFLFLLVRAEVAAELRAELLPVIIDRLRRSHRNRGDAFKHLGEVLAEPNNLLANAVWRAGLRQRTSEMLRASGIATACWLVLFAVSGGLTFTKDLAYGWPAALPITQIGLMSLWFFAAAVRFVLPVGWVAARRVSATVAWVAYASQAATLAFECPKTPAGAALIEASAAALACYGALTAARSGRLKHLRLAVPLLVIEGFRTITIDIGSCAGLPLEGIATITAALIVLAAATRHQLPAGTTA